MGSERLNKGIALAADMMAMRGPVSKRDIAEEAIRSCRPETWSETERREAFVSYAMGQVGNYIKSSVNSEIPADVWAKIPNELRKHFDDGFPKMICISEKGGSAAKYVLSLYATPDDWQKNFEMKDWFAQKVWSGRNVSRDMRNLLLESGVGCLAELAKHKVAAE